MRTALALLLLVIVLLAVCLQATGGDEAVDATVVPIEPTAETR